MQIKEIAGREIRSMFNSPVGWLILILFTAHSVFVFSGRVDSAVGNRILQGVSAYDYTSHLFTSPSSLFPYMIYFLIFYIPFLTMGSMSREFSEGGIRLLFSSPLRNGHIVLGKFAACLLAGALLIGVLVLLAIVARLLIVDSLDVGSITGALSIMYLTILLYASIGLFISSLTSYQLVAAVGTFGVIYFLNSYLSELVRNDHPEVLQRVFSLWLPPQGHQLGMAGLINLADILYFLLLIAFFLLLTWLRLRFSRTTATLKKRMWVYTVLVLMLFTSGWATYREPLFIYIDCSSSRRYSPSSELSRLLVDLPERIRFVRYRNVLESPYYGSLQGFSGRIHTGHRLRQSLTIKPALQVVPYFASTERLSAELLKKDTAYNNSAMLASQTDRQLSRASKDYSLDELVNVVDARYSWFNSKDLLGPAEISRAIDLNEGRFRNAYVLRSGHLTGVLQDYLGSPNEQAFTSVLKAMVHGSNKVVFMTGHGERDPASDDDADYGKCFLSKYSDYALHNLGFEISRIAADTLSRITADILVIADPRTPLSEKEVDMVRSYIDSGGNMLITASRESMVVVNTIISSLGVHLQYTNNTEKYASIHPAAVKPSLDAASGFLENQLMWYRNNNTSLLNSKGGGRSISVNHPLSISTVNDSLFYGKTPIVLAGKDTTMVALCRPAGGKQQRIIISADAGYLSNAIEGIGYHSAFKTEAVNYALHIALFHWLSNETFPSLGKGPRLLENLRISKSGWLKTGLILLLPLPLLLSGTIRLLRRKRM